MNIKENNKLMADFLEVKISDKLGGIHSDIALLNGIYHRNWVWLMPVIEKIEGLGYWVNSKRNFCIIEVFGNDYEAKNNNTYFVNKQQWASTKIEAVYNACIEFIQWYNNKS